MFEIVYQDEHDNGRTDGRRLDGYTISSPCEPNGSGELTRTVLCCQVHVVLSIFEPRPMKACLSNQP